MGVAGIEEGKNRFRRMHENALRKLRTLKRGDLVEISAMDNCSLEGVITTSEAWREAYNVGSNGVLTTSGYYQGHNNDFIILSADKIEDESDRGSMSVVLTKYVVEVVRRSR